ncbi:MAG: carbon-nitrogen hydrolase family protein, partial [Anaerolineae bacterium]
MRIALLQIRCFDLEQAEEGLQHALAMVDEAGGRGADLIVLPETTYPAYYLRGLREYQESPLRPWAELVELFGEKAHRYRVHIVAGIVQPGEAGAMPRNAAVLWGPDGQIIGSTAKSFLWHFDRCWFAGGTTYPVFDTTLGRVGLMVCADGRMPEIARAMALKGAQLIVDVTALVSGGGDRAALSNPQLEYMLPVRAMENGVWLVVANKVGLEASSVLYCGGSCVITPQGKKLAQAGPDREEIVECEVELAGRPALPVPRRPRAYERIAAPTETLPIARILKEAVVPEDTVVRVAALQISADGSMESYLQRAMELTDTA